MLLESATQMPDIDKAIHIDLLSQDSEIAAFVQVCAMALHTGLVAGLSWIGALPEARGQGLAAAVTNMGKWRQLSAPHLKALCIKWPFHGPYRRQ